MEIIVIVMLITIAFLWVDVRDSKVKIKRLKNRLESYNQRLGVLEKERQQAEDVHYGRQLSGSPVAQKQATHEASGDYVVYRGRVNADSEPKRTTPPAVSDAPPTPPTPQLVDKPIAHRQNRPDKQPANQVPDIADNNLLSNQPIDIDIDNNQPLEQPASMTDSNEAVSQTADLNDYYQPVKQSSCQSAGVDDSYRPAMRVPAYDREYPATEPMPAEHTPTLFDKGVDYAKNWISTGNVPVKIGMLVLFSAVIAFLRYASNKGWFTFPMEYRLLSVAGLALAALFFAWTKRHSKRSFSLSAQGGCIGILLLVIFSAVKMYGFISPTVGFALSVLMVLLAAILALAQDAKALIIMAIFAGFLAPIWLSNNSGNHVVLFSYYAILNVGIFAVAWRKPWRELNLLGFVFTYLIGTTWGGLRYTEANFATTEPFAVLFFCFYLFIPLRYAQRASTGDERYADKIDAALLFGTPLVTFGLQVGMLHNHSDWLALSSVVMGLVYAGLALVLRGRPAYTVLQQAYTGLAVGFLTLAVPIGLSAKATATIFAVEGAGALWFGARERRTLAWLLGAALQAASAVAFVIAYDGVVPALPVVFNDRYLSALLMVISAGVCVGSCHYFANHGLKPATSALSAWLDEALLATSARLFFLWGMAWWLGASAVEIERLSTTAYDHFLLLIATAGALIVVLKYYGDSMVAVAQSLLLSVGVIFALLAVVGALGHWHFGAEHFYSLYPLNAWSAAVWASYAVIGLLVWRSLADVALRIIDDNVVAWLLSLTTVVCVGIYQYWPAEYVESSLFYWAMLAPWLALTLALMRWPQVLQAWLARPTPAWQSGVTCGAFFVLILGLLRVASLSGGDSHWWLPVLNGVDSLLLLLSGVLVWPLMKKARSWQTVALAGLWGVVIASVTLRMMHHWGGFSAWTRNAHFDWSAWSDWWILTTFGFWLAVLAAMRLATHRPALAESLQWLGLIHIGQHGITLLLSLVWCSLLLEAGQAEPLPWLPLLNPLAALQWSILWALWLWLGDNQSKLLPQSRERVMPVLALLLISVMTLRFVHHYADAPWSPAIVRFAVTQMALTLVWSVLGVVAWILGSRRHSRPVWLLGAALMTVVLVKLILVDRGHLGDLFGIASFFAYGLLCVVVGYLAPMPPAKGNSNNINPAK